MKALSCLVSKGSTSTSDLPMLDRVQTGFWNIRSLLAGPGSCHARTATRSLVTTRATGSAGRSAHPLLAKISKSFSRE